MINIFKHHKTHDELYLSLIPLAEAVRELQNIVRGLREEIDYLEDNLDD